MDGAGTRRWVEVSRTGRELDAQMMRSYLEANGLLVSVWTSGMGRWRAESAITEVTGVPSDFNAHRVMVPDDQLEIARELLAHADSGRLPADATDDPDPQRASDPIGDTGADFGTPEPLRWMMLFRSRWVLVGVALMTLAMIVLGALAR